MTGFGAYTVFLREALGELRAIRDSATTDSMVLLSLPPGKALADIGACQDIIGEPALEQLTQALARCGLRVVELSKRPKSATGIGGKATSLKVILVPISMAGEAGVIEVTVLKEDVPFLLSVCLLEFLEAQIDLKKNQMRIGRLGAVVDLERLPSKHRMVSVTEWRGGAFPVSAELRAKYPELGEGAFDIGGGPVVPRNRKAVHVLPTLSSRSTLSGEAGPGTGTPAESQNNVVHHTSSEAAGPPGPQGQGNPVKEGSHTVCDTSPAAAGPYGPRSSEESVEEGGRRGHEGSRTLVYPATVLELAGSALRSLCLPPGIGDGPPRFFSLRHFCGDGAISRRS